MVNYSNYGRALELAKFQQIDEAQIGHASDNSIIGFDKLMGGEKGSPYTSNYNQLVDKIGQAVDKGEKGGTVEILHDDNSHFLTIRYEIDYTDPNQAVVSLYRSELGTKTGAANSAAGSASGTPTVQANETIKQATNKLLTALAGSKFGEDEDAVYSVFKDNVKSDVELKSLLAYWKSQKAPYVPASGRSWEKFEDIRNFYKGLYPESWDLQVWIKNLFSSDEIKKLNDIISKYSTFRFKA